MTTAFSVGSMIPPRQAPALVTAADLQALDIPVAPSTKESKPILMPPHTAISPSSTPPTPSVPSASSPSIQPTLSIQPTSSIQPTQPVVAPPSPLTTHRPPSIDPSLLSDTLKMGFLRKKGDVRKNWTTRWFVLKARCLAYYGTERDPDPKGIIQLSSCCTLQTISIKGRAGFQLRPPASERVYVICASDDADRDSWVRLIQSCIDSPDT